MASTVKLKVKTMAPATYDLEAPSNATVGDLKDQLVSKADVPKERQRLIWRGRVLQDGQLLDEAGIEDGHTLHLVERAPNLPPPQPQQPAGNGQGDGTQQPMNPLMGMIDIETDPQTINGFTEMLTNLFGGLGAGGFGDGGGGGQFYTGQGNGQQQAPGAAQGNASADRQEQRRPRRPHMLESIWVYLQELQAAMPQPPILLPGMQYPDASGRQLLEQTSLMEAARAILQSGGSLVDALPEPTRRYLETNEAWEVPPQPQRPAAGSGAGAGAWEVPPQPQRPAAASSARAGAPGQAAAPEGSTAPAAAGRAGAAAQGQRQASSSSRVPAGAGGSPAQQAGPPAVAPAVIIAMGMLFRRFAEMDVSGQAERAAGAVNEAVISRGWVAGSRLEGAELRAVQDQIRSAGSMFYRAAAVMLEMARASSALNAALLGNAAPLAFNSAAYIRPDGSRPAIGTGPNGAQPNVNIQQTTIAGPFPLHFAGPGGALGGFPVPGFPMPQSAAQAAAAGGVPLQPGGPAHQPAGGAPQQPGAHPGASGAQPAGLGGQAGEQLLAHLRQQLMEAAAAGGQAQPGEGAGAGMPGMPGAGGPQQQPQQQAQAGVAAGQVHLEHRLEVPFLPPVSVQLLQTGGEQGSQDENVSLVVNMDAARLGLGESRRFEIDVTAAARALGAAVGPQVAHLSDMMQQAAQAGQGAAGQRAAGGQPGAEPGAGAAAGTQADPAAGASPHAQQQQPGQQQAPQPQQPQGVPQGLTRPDGQAMLPLLSQFLMQTALPHMINATLNSARTAAGGGAGDADAGAAGGIQQVVNSALNRALGRDSASPAPGIAPQDAQGPSQAANGSPVRQQGDSDAAQAPAVPDVAGEGALRQDAGTPTLKRKLSESLPMSTDSPQDLGSGGLQQQSTADSQDRTTRPEAAASLQSEGGLSAAGLPASATDPAAATAAAAAVARKGKAPHAAAAASEASGGGPAEALAGDGQAPAAERSSSKPAGLGGAGLGRGKGAPARGKKASAGGDRTTAPPPAAAAALLRAAAAFRTPDAAGISSSGTGAGTSSGQGATRHMPPLDNPSIKRARLATDGGAAASPPPGGPEAVQDSIEEISMPESGAAASPPTDAFARLMSEVQRPRGREAPREGTAGSQAVQQAQQGGSGGLGQIMSQLMSDPAVMDGVQGLLGGLTQQPGADSNRGGNAGGPDLGGLLQGMMGQLFGGGNHGQAAQQPGSRAAGGQHAASSATAAEADEALDAALAVLDPEERIQWANTIRADRQAQQSAAPVSSFSEAYKAGASPAPRTDIRRVLSE